MKRVAVPVDVMETIVKYLASKPYNEVAGIIRSIEATGVLLEEREPSPSVQPTETANGKEE